MGASRSTSRSTSRVQGEEEEEKKKEEEKEKSKNPNQRFGKKPKILEKTNSRHRHTIGLTFVSGFFSLWAQSSRPKNRKSHPQKQKSKSKNIFKTQKMLE